MLIVTGKRYLTRCGLIVSVIEREEDMRDHYPMIGKYDTGARMGDPDFWMDDGNYYDEDTEHQMDLVSEL